MDKDLRKTKTLLFNVSLINGVCLMLDPVIRAINWPIYSTLALPSMLSSHSPSAMNNTSPPYNSHTAFNYSTHSSNHATDNHHADVHRVGVQQRWHADSDRESHDTNQRNHRDQERARSNTNLNQEENPARRAENGQGHGAGNGSSSNSHQDATSPQAATPSARLPPLVTFWFLLATVCGFHDLWVMRPGTGKMLVEEIALAKLEDALPIKILTFEMLMDEYWLSDPIVQVSPQATEVILNFAHLFLAILGWPQALLPAFASVVLTLGQTTSIFIHIYFYPNFVSNPIRLSFVSWVIIVFFRVLIPAMIAFVVGGEICSPFTVKRVRR
ncbi:hypothetical protein EV361DRAFT_905180 [Lentinula raphanica]|uniref:Uncharacterized protein n=1 Tax=Lentinula raphanica TaxID=153919 RepID=A0AA38PFL8_9AGAR|nr:hypothetical protein F5878DRAFT_608735 [Lentinula raphanica]KAJ3972493.1 hypothetical protein EV361DRAFT_905180 [Lentinula raphanica]